MDYPYPKRRRQHDNEEYATNLRGAAFLADGSPVVAGFVDTEENGTDFVAVKLDAEAGTVVWEWTVRGMPRRATMTRRGRWAAPGGCKLCAHPASTAW